MYRATDLTLGQAVALKFLPESLGRDERAVVRFYNEVRMARQVTHPNVCRVYDIGAVEGLHYISMEFVDGEDMASLLRRIGRLPADKALETARRLCAGLAAAHDKGVLHRDLKPANVMIDGRGQVIIMDFGLAGLSGAVAGGRAERHAGVHVAGATGGHRSDGEERYLRAGAAAVRSIHGEARVRSGVADGADAAAGAGRAGIHHQRGEGSGPGGGAGDSAVPGARSAAAAGFGAGGGGGAAGRRSAGGGADSRGNAFAGHGGGVGRNRRIASAHGRDSAGGRVSRSDCPGGVGQQDQRVPPDTVRQHPGGAHGEGERDFRAAGIRPARPGPGGRLHIREGLLGLAQEVRPFDCAMEEPGRRRAARPGVLSGAPEPALFRSRVRLAGRRDRPALEVSGEVQSSSTPRAACYISGPYLRNWTE